MNINGRLVSVLLAFSLIIIAGSGYGGDDWLQYGGNHFNNPVIETVDPVQHVLRWTAMHEDFSNSVELVQASTPIVFDGKVICHAEIRVWFLVEDPVWGDWWDSAATSYVLAFDVHQGRLIWGVKVADGVDESWSSPAVCADNRLVIMPSGDKLHLIDVGTGEMVAETTLPNPVVNASVTIADKTGYLTTSNFWGSSELMAFNLDPAKGALGGILWTALIGESSGNTPAMHIHSVTGDTLIIFADLTGILGAYRPQDEDFAWTFQAEDDDMWGYLTGTFWGGVTVSREWNATSDQYEYYAYASTFNFYGFGRTYKVNACTGEFVWETDFTERTNSTPVVYEDMVLVSGGVDWDGMSIPSLTAFDRLTGEELWWFEGAGGRSTIPLIVNGICYLGEMDEDWSYHTLHALDLSKNPEDENEIGDFIIWSYTGAGGPAAYADGSIYSIGTGGLYAFGAAPTRGLPLPGDVTLDCKVDKADLIFIRNRLGQDAISFDNQLADINGDGVVDIRDLVAARNHIGRECLLMIIIEIEDED